MHEMHASRQVLQKLRQSRLMARFRLVCLIDVGGSVILDKMLRILAACYRQDCFRFESQNISTFLLSDVC